MTENMIHGSGMPATSPLTGLGGGDLIYPTYKEPFGITLILNTAAFPILSEKKVNDAVTNMVNVYVERINGYRLLAEQRAALEIDRDLVMTKLHDSERKLTREKAKLMLTLSQEEDSKGKPAYSAEYKLKAAVEATLSSDPKYTKLDDEVSNLRQDVRGYSAKIEAVKQHMSAHREEIVAARDAISHLVNSGLVAVAGLPTEDENLYESDGVDAGDEE